MAGRQSTSRAELSVVRLRIEGGAQADLGRVRLLGDVLAFLEDADQVVADHDRRLKVRGGLPARHDRCQRQRGGEQQAGWTGIERPDASLDHAPLRGKRPASGAAGVGDGNSRRIVAGSPGPCVSLMTLLRQLWTFLSPHLTSRPYQVSASLPEL